MKRGINGIGLYRSEYLFMNKRKMPSEQEQFISIKNTKLSEGKTINHKNT